MRKTSTLLALLLMAAMPLFATHVEPERAQRVAQSFMSNNEKGNVQLQDLSKEAGFSNLYIFTTSKSFVIVAADDCVQPILGYSLTNSFVVKDMPENVKGWLQGYNEEIQYAIDNKNTAAAEVAQQWQELSNGAKGNKATVVVEPLLHTLWDQGEPYYNLCPTATSGGTTYHAVTGCVATAMAQIMKYWNWPIKGNGSHRYTPSGFPQQNVNFGNTTYDWANMTDTYDDNSTEAEQTAVATLMWHCGVSVDMQYGLDASGALSSDIDDALKNYFRYSSSLSFKYKSSYSSSWISMLKTELDNARPVQYSGSGSDGGHAFVCDGYDNSNYFHFNWGWSGMYDGYFTVNNLNPGTGGTGSGSGTFNSNQSAIFGIEPSYTSGLSAPTLNATLQQDIQKRNVVVSWNSVSGASKYQLFRNSTLIYEGNASSYTDVTAPYGKQKYYVRCVNSSNGISQNSNKVEINIQFPAPNNFTASLEEDLFSIAWDASDLAVSYNVYCNNKAIGTGLTSTEFTFTLKMYGDLTFYVKGVDFNGELSEASNAVALSQEFHGPLTDITATLNGNTAEITWDALDSDTGFITQLGDWEYAYYSSIGSTGAYWAIRFPASTLSYFAGMALLDVETYIFETGSYQVKVYQCTGDAPSGTVLASASSTYSSTGWNTLTFNNPVLLDHTKDLWIVYYSSAVTKFLFADMENENGDYYSTNGTTWYHFTGGTWLIYVDITDGEFSYNLYRNGTRIAQNLTTTSYTDRNLSNNGAYKYTVRTNYYGGESDDSNFYEYVLGNASTNNAINIARKDRLFLTENSQFTVSGNLTNNWPSNLVIENGAQLIHNSDNVQATVKTTISGFGKEEGHWHLIASPIVGKHSTEGLISDNYDLYLYNEPTEYWWNAKGNEGEDHSFNELNHGQGYLYASQNDINTSYVGALKPSNSAMSTELSFTESAPHLKGFNLVGNPFTCNAIVNMDFFVMNDAGDDLTLASSNRQIKPMEGVFVKATGAGQSVSFSKGNAKVTNKDTSIDLFVSQSEQPIDRVRVRFGNETGIEKFRLNEDNTMLSLRQHDNDMAVAYSDGENTLPVHFKAAKNGVYSINVEMENVDIDYLHLIDNMTGTDVDLFQTPSYTFESKTSDYASRFKLVFNANTSSDSESFAYFNGNSWIVNNEGEATLQVIDMMGRTISSKAIHGMAEIDLNVAGVYVLHLIRGNDVKTQKIVVK